MSIHFYSAIPDGRPKRLSEKTRQFAWDSINGKYGRALYSSPCLHMEAPQAFDQFPDMKKQDMMIRKMAEDAPLRICDGEWICGSATLLDATKHVIPVKVEDAFVFAGVSHLTCGFDKVLAMGLDAYKAQIDKRLQDDLTAEERGFIESLDSVYTSMQIWHRRYLALLTEHIDHAESQVDRNYYQVLHENLKHMPFKSPTCFREAVQSLWFTFAFIRLCGNWPGIGRIDEMLGSYLKQDIAAETITLEEAREILAHFFIKGCEWITTDHVGSGDAQHYQNIVLGGVDVNGEEVTNEVTYLVLDIIEELGISDFPIAVRINEHTSRHLYQRIAEVIRHGGGVVAVYNEKLILDSMTEYGYPAEEARRFANDGCWEVQIPGKTSFIYTAIDGFNLLQNNILQLHSQQSVDFESYEELYQAYIKEMHQQIQHFHDEADNYCTSNTPCSVVSLFTDDCIAKARSYLNRGARYNVISPHMGGIPDAVNSLYAIKKLVFEEKKVTLQQLVQILRSNWEGYEDLRRYVLYNYTYFGNDHEEVDTIAAQIMHDYIEAVRSIKYRNGVFRVPGVSTFGRQIEWRNHRGAAAHGNKKGDILAGNFSPTPGTDTSGVTAMIRSHCRADLSKLTGGTALDVKLYPTTVMGEEGMDAIISLIRGFVCHGGFFMQMDVIDNTILLEAQKHPEKYQNLAVRVSGWSARFATLDPQWQQMIIERNGQVR